MDEIKPEGIDSVLIEDGWHRVRERSFKIQPCEFGGAAADAEWKAAVWEEIPRQRGPAYQVTVPFESIRAICRIARAAS